MCLPAAAALAVAGAATSAAGAVMGGMRANQQGKYEATMARRNADQEIENARESEEMGRDERKKYWRDVAQTKGQNIAAMAANGIDVGYGSALRMQQDTEILSREDAERLNKNITARTKGHLITASNYVAEAKAARARGKAALTQGIVSGIGSLIGGAQQFSSIKAKGG